MVSTIFVNYLGALFGSERRWYTHDALAAHAEAIDRNRERFADDEVIGPKYEWLADYHDYFVTQIYWCPQCVVGSSQSHDFAPLTSRFGVDSLLPEPLASGVRRSIVQADVRTIVAAGRPAAGELVHADYPDLQDFANDWWQAVMAIYCLGALRRKSAEQRVPPEHIEGISEFAFRCDALVRSLAPGFLGVTGSFRVTALECLRELADALRLVRQQPELCDVGLLKVEELVRGL
jgi:hypothetical protein